MFKLYGWNPVPYSFLRNLFLLVNTGISHAFIKRLTRSWWGCDTSRLSQSPITPA